MSETHTTQTGAEINRRAYPPGSDLAHKSGCRCPRMDNGYGRGAYGGVVVDGAPIYVVSYACPLHAPTAPDGGGAP